MQLLILMLHIILGLSLVVLVLMQHGRGADAGSSFGGGATAQSVFGSAGPTSFLVRLTFILGIIFFVTSFVLGILMWRTERRPVVVNTQPASVATQHSGVPVQF